MYEQEYSNIKLPAGTTLSVSNVVIKIESDNASSEPLNSREEFESEKIELSNGHHEAGEDFPAGIYSIKAIKGGGNVSSDNPFSGGINAILGTEEMNRELGTDMYEEKYMNISLPQGTTLSIDGVKVELIPVK